MRPLVDLRIRQLQRDGGDCTSMVSGTHTRTSLLERLGDGADPVIWSDFFQRYWPLVFSFARQRGCTQHTAEEIVQEVMLAIFERKAVFRHDPSRGRFRDWLGGVVRNKVRARRRAPGERCRARGGQGDDFPEPESVGDAPDALWEAAFEQAMLAFLLDMVRCEVPPRTYQAFEAVAIGGCSGAEAARLTGLTRNAVYLARRKVLGRLRELGAVYGRQGPPDDMIRAAIRSRPSAAVERSLITRIEQTKAIAVTSDKSPLPSGEN
jgi:RNA polymerase sigma factor (sigma-70 family)